jgi:hypothetical protein
MLVGAAATSAAAQAPNCNKRVEIVRHLATVYAEAPVALGTASNGSVVELFHSKDGRSWTLTITAPDGETCMIAAGEDWNRLPPVERILHGS